MSTKTRWLPMSQASIDADLARGLIEPLPPAEGGGPDAYRFTDAGNAAFRDMLRRWAD